MVYDTLFALDEKLAGQAADGRQVGGLADKLTWTFTLRDGLEWHDGKPVTAEDCVASIKRWGAKRSMGQKLMGVVAELTAPDAKTIKMVLKEPYGLVLETLGKPSSNVPFMMPKRVAETDPNTQITDATGSGPFIFKKDEWKAGREGGLPQEPEIQAARRAGLGLGRRQGRQGRPRRMDLDRRPADPGECADQRRDRLHRDRAARPAAAAAPRTRTSRSMVVNTAGRQYAFRFNVLHKPFDNAKVRQAVLYALDAEGVPGGQRRQPRVLHGVQVAVSLRLAARNRPRAGRTSSRATSPRPRSCWQQAGYDGTPVVLMHQTDIASPQQPRHRSPSRCWRRPASRSTCRRWTGRRWWRAAPRRIRRPRAAGAPIFTSWGSVDVLEPGVGRLPQRLLRQGDLRLAVRCRAREAARCLRQGDRSGQAEGDRRAGPAARAGVSDARAARPVHARRRRSAPTSSGLLTPTPSLALWNIEKK